METFGYRFRRNCRTSQKFSRQCGQTWVLRHKNRYRPMDLKPRRFYLMQLFVTQREGKHISFALLEEQNDVDSFLRRGYRRRDELARISYKTININPHRKFVGNLIDIQSNFLKKLWYLGMKIFSLINVPSIILSISIFIHIHNDI